MNIEDLTIRQARELLALLPTPHPAPVVASPTTPPAASDTHWELGKPYLIRTVTMIDVGILVAVTDKELVLEDAAWVADTGRFADALLKCEFNEVEPFPQGKVIIGRGAIVDAVRLSRITRTQK